MQPVRARLIPFAHRNAFENMATDEYLISWIRRTGVPVLRIYAWSPPAISLGRYQRTDCIDIEACRADGVDIVRRITGGGAIFHCSEVTYSLACPGSDPGDKLRSVPESFALLNRFIIAMYRSMGLPAAYAQDVSAGERTGRRAPFCFSSNEKFDILIEGKKIGGNAQCRIGGVVLQHGSIPLSIDRDRIAKYFYRGVTGESFTSLNEITGIDTSPESVTGMLAESYAGITGMDLYDEQIGAAEQAEIHAIMRQKYLQSLWNMEGKTEDDEVRKAAMAQ